MSEALVDGTGRDAGADRLLLLLRHGKSDWKAPFGADRERPLAPRGRKAVQRMGRFLSAARVVPDLVLTSPAVRAHDTADLITEAARWPCPVTVLDDLYDGGIDAAMAVVRAAPEAVRTLLAVGHEPTWSALASTMAGGGSLRLPTAAVACLRLDVPGWTQLSPGGATLLWLVTPRLLGEAPR